MNKTLHLSLFALAFAGIGSQLKADCPYTDSDDITTPTTATKAEAEIPAKVAPSEPEVTEVSGEVPVISEIDIDETELDVAPAPTKEKTAVASPVEKPTDESVKAVTPERAPTEGISVETEEAK